MLKNLSLARFFERHLQPSGEAQTLSFSQKQLAAAALLIEIAAADDVFDPREFSVFKSIVTQTYTLSTEQTDELLELARSEQSDATSLYQFTQIINQHCTQPEKFTLIKSMWEIAFADNQLDKYEEHMIRKVADLIYLSHTDFLVAKKVAKDESHN